MPLVSLQVFRKIIQHNNHSLRYRNWLSQITLRAFWYKYEKSPSNHINIWVRPIVQVNRGGQNVNKCNKGLKKKMLQRNKSRILSQQSIWPPFDEANSVCKRHFRPANSNNKLFQSVHRSLWWASRCLRASRDFLCGTKAVCGEQIRDIQTWNWIEKVPDCRLDSLVQLWNYGGFLCAA